MLSPGASMSDQDHWDELAATEADDAEPSAAPAQPAQPAQPAATRIGRFALLERIGAGAMGEVFAAYDEQLDRKVALKIVHPSIEASPTSQARLLREARALARLSHPNVVTVFDSGLHDGKVFIAMEFVRGKTLQAWLGESPRSWEAILEVFVAVGRGLEAMHELGLVHRDLKPSNVLIDERGRPRLIDFGIVGDLERPEADAPEPAEDGAAAVVDRLDRLTRTGAMIGTPRYMSPEQFQGCGVSTASDQFSFCVVLFEALYQRSPFGSDGLHSLIAAVLDGRIDTPPRSADVPRELGAVVLRGLQRQPGARWPGMTELLDVLGTVLASYEHGVDDASARRSQRRIGSMLIAAMVAVLTCGLALVGAGSIELSSTTTLAIDIAVLAITAVLMFVLRSRWRVHARARTYIGVFFLILTTYTAQNLVSILTDRSLYDTVLGNAVFLAVILCFAAPLLGRALLLCGAWAALVTALIVIDPPRYFAYFTAGNVGATLISVVFVSLRNRTASTVLELASSPSASRTDGTSRSRSGAADRPSRG
jgi:tRNA A-37 threonylcarbamoyl transferase component Bud32